MRCKLFLIYKEWHISYKNIHSSEFQDFCSTKGSSKLPRNLPYFSLKLLVYAGTHLGNKWKTITANLGFCIFKLKVDCKFWSVYLELFVKCKPWNLDKYISELKGLFHQNANCYYIDAPKCAYHGPIIFITCTHNAI